MQEDAREEGGWTEPTSRTCRVVAMVIVIRMCVKELCGYDRCDEVSGGRRAICFFFIHFWQNPFLSHHPNETQFLFFASLFC